jgi:hypothetical protein
MDFQHLKWIYRALRYRYRLEPREIRLVQRHRRGRSGWCSAT